MRELLLKIRALLLRFGAADERAAATAVTLGLLEEGDLFALGERVEPVGETAARNSVAATDALAAAGAQIVLFSTGRGTPFASPVPTVKISSNSRLAGFKHGWIDFNAGELLDGVPLPDMSRRLMDFVLKTASGQKVCAERHGFHDLAIFKTGVTL